MRTAIDMNRIPVLEWMEQERNLPKPEYSIHCKHANTAYWLHARGYKLSVHVEIDIGRDNRAFLQWINDHKQEVYIRRLGRGIAIAASNNHLELAKWLLETYPDKTGRSRATESR